MNKNFIVPSESQNHSIRNQENNISNAKTLGEVLSYILSNEWSVYSNKKNITHKVDNQHTEERIEICCKNKDNKIFNSRKDLSE